MRTDRFRPFPTQSRPTTRTASRRRAAALGGAAVTAAAGFGVVAAATARRATAHVDRALLPRLAAPARHPAREIAHAVAVPGKWWAYLPMAVELSAYLLRAPRPRRARGRAAGAGAVLFASALAAALGPAFDRWLPQPPAPPGHRSRRKPVFPSGHALGTTALALTGAYVLTRESLARPGVAVPAALAALVVPAGGKLAEERHWASDVLGGYLGGAAIAGASLAAYELARGA